MIDNANLTEKQISSLDDKTMIVKTTFSNSKPTYVLTKTCSPAFADIDFNLIGEKNMSFEVGDGGQYIEPGATALNKAGETVSYTTTITNSKKETVTYVDTTKVDTYTIKYSATIDGENYSIERIVKVIDTTAPIITVNPTSETIAITNSTYNVLSGVTASDNSGDIPTIKASTNLSLGQAGTYTITYTATDSSGNKKTAKRTVIISNSSLVSITLVGNKEANHYANSGTYIDAGATAIDNVGTNLTSSLVKIITNNGSIVSDVEVDEVTTYYLTYAIIKDGVTYSETRKINIIANNVYANGTAVYFNPETGTKCTAVQAVSTFQTKTGCMKWYTFLDAGDMSSTINLFLDHNTKAYAVWNSSGSNITGPNEIMNQLSSDTITWLGVPVRTDSYSLNNGTANYTINYSGYRARLISYGEMATIIGRTDVNEPLATPNLNLNQETTPSKYAWLYNYTNSCVGYGCSIAENTTWGYWTATARSYDSTSVVTGDNRGITSMSTTSYGTAVGLRPVITIPKSILD